ncbi:MAG: proton-conducting transporter membrane subunit [Candidatus Avigastranaerophilus sp.]
MITLYAFIHLICSVSLCLDYNPCDIQQNMFAVDELNRIFLIVLSIVYIAVAIYNKGYMKDDKSLTKKLRYYSCAILLFVLSMTGAILSTNLGITWVFIEATTLASAYLIYFHKTKHSIEAAWKYVFICSIGIALAFVGIILLTISTGNLNSLSYSDLYYHAQNFNSFWLKLSFIFILFGIGTKMGLAPVHFWLPDAHAQSPSPISALLSATLLNSAFLMILKVFKIMIIAGYDNYARIMLITMGFSSLFVAAVFVYHINNYKRMLAYSSIENMGILAIGTALGGAGMFAAIIHMIGHSLIKASFFMTSGNILKIYKTKKIKSVTGLLESDKQTGWLWIISCLGIVAFPPSVLFISEYLIVKAMFQSKHYWMCAVFLLLLTIVLYGLARAVFTMSVNDRKEHGQIKLAWTMYAPQAVLLIIAFVMGIYLPYYEIILKAVNGF